MIAVPDLSIIIPVTDARYDDISEVFHGYKQALAGTGLSTEFIFVLDGPYPEIFESLKAMRAQGENIKVIKFAQWFGESVATAAGCESAQGEMLLLLPAYHQIDAAEIPKLLSGLKTHDMVTARRHPRSDPFLKRFQSFIFRLLVRFLTGMRFHDLGCMVRAIKPRVMREVQLYGDLHRFLPLLAFRQGFKVTEMEVRPSAKNTAQLFYAPGTYVRRLLDLLSVLFMVKFTKKPLRFFGLLGSSLFGAGAVAFAILFIQRVFLGVALADRPIVLVPALLISLGVQLLTIGLIGEIIIFTHAKDMKEYTIEEIVN